jgi:peptide alpha-N-acetyltransferase
MKEDGVDEVSLSRLFTFYILTLCQIVLETEYDNRAALSLYESLGFIREKRLHRFYLNGKDAFRLVLAVPCTDDSSDTTESSSRSRRPNRMPYRAIRVSPYSDDEDDDYESTR